MAEVNSPLPASSAADYSRRGCTSAKLLISCCSTGGSALTSSWRTQRGPAYSGSEPACLHHPPASNGMVGTSPLPYRSPGPLQPRCLASGDWLEQLNMEARPCACGAYMLGVLVSLFLAHPSPGSEALVWTRRSTYSRRGPRVLAQTAPSPCLLCIQPPRDRLFPIPNSPDGSRSASCQRHQRTGPA